MADYYIIHEARGTVSTAWRATAIASKFVTQMEEAHEEAHVSPSTIKGFDWRVRLVEEHGGQDG